MESRVWVLEVNQDTWKRDKWRTAGVFDVELDAILQGQKFRDEHGNYAGYRTTETLLNPEHEQWKEEGEE